MRSFDTWNRYLDNNGNPLHGCVQFMVKDGNTVAPIYGSDGTALDNPQLTDIYGRTQHQVFIDVDVVAYFYKYIGDGIWSSQEGIDTSDQTKWTLEYTIENQNTMSRTVDSTGTYAVSTISSLRELDIDEVPEINGVKVITLLGYNKIGDKEPINYYWDPESTETDNDGSVIKYEDEITGRWIMIQPTHHCDSRHFGVFPSNSYNTTDNTYGISKLFEYCNNKGISPFFDTNGDYVWYRYNYLNISSDNPIIVSDGIQFYDNEVSTIGGEWIGDPHFVQRNTNVIAKNVKTSWDAKSYTGYENVILDKYTDQKNWQDAHIDTRMLTYGYNFNNCTFEENRNLGSNNGSDYNTFYDCKLTSKMFIVSGDNATSFATGQASNCEACLCDWIDSDDSFYYYIQLRMTNSEDPGFDYNNVTSTHNPIRDYTGRIVTGNTLRLANFNYIGASGCVLSKLNASVLEINNCSGKYNLNGWGNATVLIKNCKDIILTEVPNNLTLLIEDSSVSLESSDYLNALSIKGSQFVAQNGVILTCKDYTSYDSIVSCEISCKNCVVKDSQINNPLSITFDNSYGSNAYIDNNIFNAQIRIYGTNTEISNVLATITNNYSSAQSPIFIDRQYINSVESSHSYTYKNNKGTFLPSIEEGCILNRTITLRGPGGSLATDWGDNAMIYNPNQYIVIPLDNIWKASNPNEHRGISGPLNFFRIGLDAFTVSVNWRITNTSVSNSIPDVDLVIPFEFKMNCVNVNGYWRLDTIEFPNGQSSSRITYNKTGLAINGGYAEDYAGTTLNCIFNIHINP